MLPRGHPLLRRFSDVSILEKMIIFHLFIAIVFAVANCNPMKRQSAYSDLAAMGRRSKQQRRSSHSETLISNDNNSKISASAANTMPCMSITSDPENKRKWIRECRDYYLANRQFEAARRLDAEYGLDDPIFADNLMYLMNAESMGRIRYEISKKEVYPPPRNGGFGIRSLRESDAKLLIGAIEQGDIVYLRQLLEFGVDPNPLYSNADMVKVAKDKERIDMVQLLIKYGGFSPNGDMMTGRVSLFQSTYNQDYEEVQRLIDSGVPATVSLFESTTLEVAISKRDLKMVKILMEGGFNLKANKMRSLHSALSNLEILLYLWPELMHQDQVDNLFQAACLKSHDTKILDFLLEKGANLDGNPEVDKFTPLMYSMVNYREIERKLVFGNSEIFDYLISIGASTDARNREGLTPVMVAAALGQFEFYKKLIEGGVDLGAMANDGRSLRDIVESLAREKVTGWNHEEALALLSTESS
eukprot:Partr_v1_DN28739_c1_g1_i1_m61645 putative Ankyrin repeat